MTQTAQIDAADWRPAPGFEGAYEVNSSGQVRRVGRAHQSGKGHGGGARVGRILKVHLSKQGYQIVQLWREGRPSMLLVHRLVAGAFLGRSDLVVNHRNGVKTDNQVGNLEFVTPSENNLHALRTGLREPHRGPNARRQPRCLVPCACGCGESLTSPDPKGRVRRFISGHNMRSRD